MKISDFTPTELSLIEAEAKECGFPNAEKFIEIQAGQWRLAILSATDAFARQMPDADERVAFGQKVEHYIKHKSFEVRREGSDAYSYLLFPDGSLYLDSNAEDGVWASAEDFADEHLVNLPIGEIHRAERQLLRKLGGIYKDAISDWKAEKRASARRRYAEQAVLAISHGNNNVDASNTVFFWGEGANVSGFRFTSRPGLSKQEFIANAARWERINLKKTGGHIPAASKGDAALEAAGHFAEMAEAWANEIKA